MSLDRDFYTKEVFGRVMEKFGQRDWTKDKIRLVYDIVKPLNEKEFSMMVDELILDYPRTPTGKDLKILVSKIFELRASSQKRENTNLHKMKLSQKDESRFFQLLLKTMANPDEKNTEALNKALDYLKSIAPKTRCNKCLDTGTVVAIKNSSEYAFKCFCSTGIENQNNWSTWKNQEDFKIKGV